MGRFLRPKAKVLPDSALIPKDNQLERPPARFTHKVKTAQPFFYEDSTSSPAGGSFEAGTRVALLGHGRGPLCRVADASGLSVFTAFDGLAALT